MIDNLILQILLFPLSLIYGIVVGIRGLLYRWGIVRATSFSVPVIAVGNLSVGGAGKTPHVEYLTRMLAPYLPVAIMSRGYGRKTRGFKIVNRSDSARSVGDEPFQYFLKYPMTKIAVSESRALGIPLLMSQHPEIKTILLDDSFQHRSVKPGKNILLTEYGRPYYSDWLMPSGRLREWRGGADRADTIIVSKCPDDMTPAQRDEVLARIKPNPDQTVYFTRFAYRQPYDMRTTHQVDLADVDEIVLLTAIAQEDYLLYHLSQYDATVHSLHYEDHHDFSPHEVSNVKLQYDQLPSQKKIILTTEKDAARLLAHRDYIMDNELPIYVLPITVEFLFGGEQQFDQEIKDFLIDFKV